MSKAKSILVIAEGADNIAALVSGAKVLGENVTLVFSGAENEAVGADKAYRLAGESFTLYLNTIVELAKEIKPELVITDCGKNGRLIAGIIAGCCGAGLISDVSEIVIEGDSVSASRMVYGGVAFKTDKVKLPMAVVCVSAGSFVAADLQPCADISVLEASGAGIKFVEKQAVETAKVNLAAAKKIIAVGRGVADESVLGQVLELAQQTGFEVGCTRPIAEEQGWMPKETYIGVSGAMLKPETYIGLGVSGQVQHMVGINSAKQVFAINKDKNAPIFKQCDYGLVADIAQVLPALKELL